MLSLNTVFDLVFFLLLPTWTYDTFLTLRGTWGFYLTMYSLKSYRVLVGWVVGWVANNILVTAQRPNSPFPSLDLTWTWTGTWPRTCQ